MLSAASTRSPGDRAELQERVLDDQLARLAVGELLDVRLLDPEVHAQLLEDRPPARRAGGEDEPAGELRAQGRTGPISRAADSGESEPCTRLVCTSRP